MSFNLELLYTQIGLCIGSLVKLYIYNDEMFNFEREGMLSIFSIITIIITTIYTINLYTINETKESEAKKYNKLFNPIGLIINTVLSGILLVIILFGDIIPIIIKYKYNIYQYNIDSWILLLLCIYILTINSLYTTTINKYIEYARNNLLGPGPDAK